MIVEVTHANIFAKLALLLWPLVTIALFMRFRPQLALTLSALGSVMLLPEVVVLADLPVVPDPDKQVIATSSIFLGALFSPEARDKIFASKSWPGFWTLLILLIWSAVGTSATNGDSLEFGRTELPGLSYYDAFATVIRDLVLVAAPFFVARSIYRDGDDAWTLLVFFVAATLVYALPVLIEWRLSPQVHSWIYGFGQHSFEQTKRGGGWRPMVLMSHGLALAFFVVVGLVSAAGLAKLGGRVFDFSTRLWMGVLALLLFMCNSLGALIYGIISVPLVLFTKKGPIRLAIVVATLALVFPYLRVSDTFPTDYLVEQAAKINADRASSLDFRFANEDALLKRALERWVYGWGAFGRSKIFDEEGKEISVSDGEWIIQLGVRGVFGFTVRFGLLVVPVWIAWRRWRALETDVDKTLLSTLALIAALAVVELLPNGLFSFLAYFYSGALAGVVGGIGRPLPKPLAPRSSKRPARRARWTLRGPVAAPPEPVVGVGGSRRPASP